MATTEHAIQARAGITRRAFAVFLALHGFAHLVGTTGSFKDAADGRTVDYLGGLWPISDPTLQRVVGIAWALVAAAYLVVAWAFWTGAPWRLAALVAATVPSLALSVAAMWTSWVGVVIDVLLLAAALWLRPQRGEVRLAPADRRR